MVVFRGSLAAHLLRLITPRRVSHPEIASLVFENMFLAVAALKGVSEFWLIPGISFVATLQTMFFTHSGTVTCSSVTTTSNLRRCIHLLFESAIHGRNAAGLHKAAVLGAISLSFALGAVVGGLTTPRLHDAALCVPAVFLFIAVLDIYRCVLSSRQTKTSGTAFRPDGHPLSRDR
jgi:uncharacterized membrane protein YoaK (UPF0700 family)